MNEQEIIEMTERIHTMLNGDLNIEKTLEVISDIGKSAYWIDYLIQEIEIQ